MPKGLTEAERSRRDQFVAASQRLEDISVASRGRKRTAQEQRDFDSAMAECNRLEREINAIQNRPSQPDEVGRGGVARGNGNTAMTDSLTGRTYRSVHGTTNERLAPDQSFAEWNRAHFGDLSESRTAPHSFNWNAYWAARLTGVENAETRAVTGWGEDVASGPGAGLNLVGQVWSSQVIDLIRAHTFSDALGATVMPLMTELTNLPVFQADVAPVYVAEGAAVQGDISPQVSVLQFNCAGAVMDIAPVSKNLLMDAVGNGTVDNVIRNSIAQKYARVIDMACLYGVNGSPGNPGLCAESGLVTHSSTNATTYVDLSAAAALVRGQNVEPNGFLWHPSTMSAYAQLQDTLHQPLRMTPDIENLSFVNSGLLNYQTESAAGAFNSGALSSIYVGDWSYMTIGMRTEGIGVQVLHELLAAQNQVGFLSAARFSNPHD